MKHSKKKIGIWGLGKVGKSAVEYFLGKQYEIEVLDKKTLKPEEKMFLKKHNIAYYDQENLEHFLQRNEFILPSPGINLQQMQQYKEKCICELDILQKEFHKPIIGITGSVGKTTITHIANQTLQAKNISVWTGGNIGTPMLQLLKEKRNIQIALLELSSFQLEQSKTFCPDIAVWTNFYPNHLDRHGTLQSYFEAKKNIIRNQKSNQHALLPLKIIDRLGPLEQYNSNIYFVSPKKPTDNQLKKLRPDDQLLYLQNNTIFKYVPHTNKTSAIAKTNHWADFTFQENLLIIQGIFYIIKKYYGLSEAMIENMQLKTLEHRLEKCCTIHSIDFYNDSKSTTPASTLAAVRKLSCRPIILLLGGLSKGVDRTPLIKKIKPHVKHIISFGKEAELLKQLCKKEQISCTSFAHMQEAVMHSFDYAKPKDQILLSPSGSSFDLFENYIARGNHFKKIVQQITQQN